MTHPKLVSFTCLSLLLTACGGGELFNAGDDPAACLDVDGDDVCDDVDLCTGDDASGDVDEDGVCDAQDLCLGDDAAGDDDDDGICDEGDACAGDDATGDTDEDGVCDDIDTCAGDDATGDSDADGICDERDACAGNDESGDSDADGLCDDQDACLGDDASGDLDGDAVCDDRDLCHGDDATGDSDGSGTCDGALNLMAGAWNEAASAGSLAGTSAPILRDVDADGDLDVVTRHHNQRRLVEWTNASGLLAEGPSVSTSAKPHGHDLSDLDGDGDLDLVSGGNVPGNLVFVENLGQDDYANETFVSAAHYTHLIVMPVNGDARPDIVAFDRSNQQLVLALNTSDDAGLSMAAPITIDSLASNAFSGPGMAAVDIDGDNDLDLVVSAAELTVYENLGGAFAPPSTIDTSGLGSSIYTADLDHDGDDDIVGIRGGNAVWYENLGDGSFSLQQTVADGDFGAKLAVGDLDGDGDTDVVLRNATTDELVWVENGLNGLVVRAPIGTAPASFVVGDLDGDGDGDVVAVDPSNDGLVTLLNPLF